MAGDPDKELEVIAQVTPEQIAQMKEFIENTQIEVEHVDNGITFDIIVTLYKEALMQRCALPITTPMWYWLKKTARS